MLGYQIKRRNKMKTMRKTIATVLCILTVLSLCSCSLVFNEEKLKGSWSATIDYEELCEADGDEGLGGKLSEAFAEKGLDMSDFSYNEGCDIVVTYEFDGNGKYTCTVDKTAIKDYLDGYMNAMIDYMVTREGLAVIMDTTVEEIDKKVEQSGKSFEEFAAEVREGLYEQIPQSVDTESLIEDVEFDFEGEGSYEIKGLSVYLDGNDEGTMSYSDDKLNSIYPGDEKEIEIEFTKE